MPTWLLFLGPTLIWASTWHVILYQLGQVPVLNSVGWRFALAAAHGDENGEKNRVALLKEISPEQQQQAQQLIATWKAGAPLPQ